MSETPPPTPPTMNYETPPGPAPIDAVKGPSIFLLVVGALTIVGQLIGILMNLLGVGIGAASRGGGMAMLQGSIGLVLNALVLAISVVVILGALKMMKLKSYNLAMASAIGAMIPCSLCCLIGLPAGIWALVVLMKPEVKAAFTK